MLQQSITNSLKCKTSIANSLKIIIKSLEKKKSYKSNQIETTELKKEQQEEKSHRKGSIEDKNQ